MLKQQDMTYTAKIIYCCLSKNNWKSVEYLANLMRISAGRCQLILTQLVMAGLAIEDKGGENFKRCH
jgi:predicted transcriptional regulator